MTDVLVALAGGRIMGEARRLRFGRLTLVYDNEGGPGAGAMVEVIRTHSSEPGEDARTFIRACVFNWLIGGTDAHAKNFSMLIGGGGRVRLAPLYDVASTLVYDFDVKKLKLATSLYRSMIFQVSGSAWRISFRCPGRRSM